jgi:hypothetical protein
MIHGAARAPMDGYCIVTAHKRMRSVFREQPVRRAAEAIVRGMVQANRCLRVRGKKSNKRVTLLPLRIPLSPAKQGIMALSGNRDVKAKALAIPFLMIAVLVTFVEIMAKWGITAAVSFWVVLTLAMWAWAFAQIRRGRHEIRGEIERSGYKVVKMNHRYLRLGPFSIWNTSRSQLVYRVVVREESTGRERIVWARWGRQMYWDPDTLELKWQE